MGILKKYIKSLIFLGFMLFLSPLSYADKPTNQNATTSTVTVQRRSLTPPIYKAGVVRGEKITLPAFAHIETPIGPSKGAKGAEESRDHAKEGGK